MKQPPRKRAAVLKSVDDFDKDSTTGCNIADPTDNDKVAQAARQLATVYKTAYSGTDAFPIIYEALIANYDGSQRRQFHRKFREALL